MEQLRDESGMLLRDTAVARAELQMAKARVLANPNSLDLRLELAEAYRVRGFPDQAGRWGILAEGWSTALELSSFARMLASPQVSDLELRKLLLLPGGMELPAHVSEVLAGRVKSSRSRTPLAAWLDGAFAVTLTIAFCLFAGTVLLVFLVAVGGLASATGIARFGGLAAVAVGLIAAALGGASSLLSRRNSPASE